MERDVFALPMPARLPSLLSLELFAYSRGEILESEQHDSFAIADIAVLWLASECLECRNIV